MKTSKVLRSLPRKNTTWTFWPADPGVHIWKDMEVVWAGDISVEDYMYDHQKLWDKARKKNQLLPVGAR